MEIVQFIYKNQPVDFEPISNENVMVNATQMAKVFKKQTESFTRNENTQKFIKECLSNENSRYLGIQKEEDLITINRKNGTWMHRILALKFAAWLDPAFELFVFITIDKLLNRYYNEQRELIDQEVSFRAKKEKLKQQLLLENPKIQDYFDLEKKVKELRNKKTFSSQKQFKEKLNQEFKQLGLFDSPDLEE